MIEICLILLTYVHSKKFCVFVCCWQNLNLSRVRIGEHIGAGNIEFIRAVRKKFVDFMGKNYSNIPKQGIANTLAFIRKLSDEAPQPGLQVRSESLEQYCPLLARFELFASLFPAKVVEIPGQYHGRSRPDPVLHVRIVSFAPNVSVMASLRRPKALTALGNDQKEYKMLVKSGEDLRLDQRVEQLFEAMNEVMGADPACRRRQLQLVTYQVTPMSTGLGVLSWIPNSVPLKGLVFANDNGAFERARQNWAQWINDVWTGPLKQKLDERTSFPAPRFFQLCLTKVSTSAITTHLTQSEDSLPEDLLLTAISRQCASPEAFLTVRQRFASSFAALSVASFVLGIHDRHLDNFMFLKSTGQVAAIDFGAAFGLGLNMPVPELMPIRLTRQLRSVLRPLDTTGLLKHDMVHAMGALRRGREALLPVLAVFVHEPIAEWSDISRNFRAQGDDDAQQMGLSDSSAWYPRKKIQIARMKLEGRCHYDIIIDHVR